MTFSIGDRIEFSGGTHEVFGGPMFHKELATVKALNGKDVFFALDNGASMVLPYYVFPAYFDEVYGAHGNGD